MEKKVEHILCFGVRVQGSGFDLEFGDGSGW